MSERKMMRRASREVGIEMKENEDLARSIIPVSSDPSGFSRGTITAAGGLNRSKSSTKLLTYSRTSRRKK
jgi:hypothetical protein